VEPPQEVRPAGNLVDGRDGSAPKPSTTEGDGLGDRGAVAGGHDEWLRRSRGQACRGKAGHRSRRTVRSERGNRLLVASLPASRVGNGKARRLSMALRWDGGSVVVRGRESRSHGEGTQRVRSDGAGMPGGRW
jgi:hypothetical protein